MSIGFTQILLIILVILLLFGAGRLPRVMGDFAKGIKSFRKGMKEEFDEDSDDGKSEPPKKIENKSGKSSSAKGGKSAKKSSKTK